MLNADKILLDFYRYYPSDHWIYKATMLKNILENYEKVENILNLEIIDVIENDYKKMMKAEIHFAYFHMVEALFELIFALEKLDDKKLWLHLSLSRGYQLKKRIPKIAKGELDFLDLIITLRGGYELPFIQYVFFFIKRFPVKMLINKEETLEINQEILEKNFEFIKKALKILANDYQNRLDYNSYKHSLRYFHYPVEIELGKLSKEEKGTPLIKFGAEDSFTFLCSNKECVDLKTKGFDWKQDYKKIILCHDLIMSIINTRKAILLRERDSKVALFHERDITEIYQQDHTLAEVKTTLFVRKKIKNPSNC